MTSAARRTHKKFQHLVRVFRNQRLSSAFGKAFVECWIALDSALLSEPERLRLGAIRHRMKTGYVFDRPGEIVITREQDIEWMIERLEARD